MEYPFIDAGKLSDDELMRRIQKCYQILSGEMAMGHTSMVNSARLQLETYQFEWNERMQSRFRKEFIEKNPAANDTIEIGTTSQYYHPDDDDENSEETEK